MTRVGPEVKLAAGGMEAIVAEQMGEVDALGLPTRAIAAQTGWSERAVGNLLTVYGHIDVIALEESGSALRRRRRAAARPFRCTRRRKDG